MQILKIQANINKLDFVEQQILCDVRHEKISKLTFNKLSKVLEFNQMQKLRKIFFVVASGGHGTDKHYYDTIERKRTIDEAERFLKPQETEILKSQYHSGPFAIWGAVPGSGNMRTWEAMEAGDYVLIYKSGKVIFAAEVALKTRSPQMADYLWGKDENGNTWEYMYFLINTQEAIVSMAKLNPYLGYSEKYFPRGFMAIDQSKANELLAHYGDVLSALRKIEMGKNLERVDDKVREDLKIIEEKIEKAPTEHTEMQWRLISIGKKAKVDVWVPQNDQNREFEGHKFKNEVLSDFQETIDVPIYIKNIDVVWKFGHSIKSAFEIEHSTSVYSGILRLSDLNALTPNSSYPLFIVADRDRRSKVFSELQRPTFNNAFIRMPESTAYLSYDKVREIDESFKDQNANISLDFLVSQGEKISLV